MGLVFLVPGLVAEGLPTSFAYAVAFGDLASGLLALLSLVALRKHWSVALPLVWIFNLVGTLDLLNALRQAGAVPHLGAAWYVPTFWVPVLLVTHVLIFARLLLPARIRLENYFRWTLQPALPSSRASSAESAPGRSSAQVRRRPVAAGTADSWE